MSWNTRIREAFDSTGRHIDDAVIEELADHADDLEADLRQRGVEAAAVEREVATAGRPLGAGATDASISPRARS